VHRSEEKSMVNEDIVKTLSYDKEKKGDEPTVVASEAHQPLSFGALLIVGVCMVWTNIINVFSSASGNELTFFLSPGSVRLRGRISSQRSHGLRIRGRGSGCDSTVFQSPRHCCWVVVLYIDVHRSRNRSRSSQGASFRA
jgi:hypothetical protein